MSKTKRTHETEHLLGLNPIQNNHIHYTLFPVIQVYVVYIPSVIPFLRGEDRCHTPKPPHTTPFEHRVVLHNMHGLLVFLFCVYSNYRYSPRILLQRLKVVHMCCEISRSRQNKISRWTIRYLECIHTIKDSYEVCDTSWTETLLLFADCVTLPYRNSWCIGGLFIHL